MSVTETVYKGEIRPWGKTKKSLGTVHIPRNLAADLEGWRRQCPNPSPDAFIFSNQAGGFLDTDNYRKRVLHKLARKLKLPKLTFQVIRRTIATLAQKKGTVKDVQGVLRHSRTATTVDVYMQEIRARAESFGPVEPAHYIFAAFVPKFTFSRKKVIDYNVTGFDPTTHVHSWRTAWRTLTKKAGLPGFRFHDLRHCAITSLAESGASDSTIMSIAGHVSRKMLERYSHVRMEAKRTAMETLSKSSTIKGYDTNHDTNALPENVRIV